MHGHASALPIATPVLTTRVATHHGELACFSMFTTFGKPQDITLASLRAEHMFAADGRTAKVFLKISCKLQRHGYVIDLRRLVSAHQQ